MTYFGAEAISDDFAEINNFRVATHPGFPQTTGVPREHNRGSALSKGPVVCSGCSTWNTSRICERWIAQRCKDAELCSTWNSSRETNTAAFQVAPFPEESSQIIELEARSGMFHVEHYHRTYLDDALPRRLAKCSTWNIESVLPEGPELLIH